MPWPRWEVRARHDNKKLRKSDESSRDLLKAKIQFFAMIFQNFFDAAKDDLNTDTEKVLKENPDSKAWFL